MAEREHQDDQASTPATPKLSTKQPDRQHVEESPITGVVNYESCHTPEISTLRTQYMLKLALSGEILLRGQVQSLLQNEDDNDMDTPSLENFNPKANRSTLSPSLPQNLADINFTNCSHKDISNVSTPVGLLLTADGGKLSSSSSVSNQQVIDGTDGATMAASQQESLVFDTSKEKCGRSDSSKEEEFLCGSRVSCVCSPPPHDVYF